jgi:tetratricopeptide repeat protein
MALSEIEKLERRYAENPQGLTFAPLAEVHRKNGDVGRALELLRPGLTLHPDYVPASIVLGRCHLDLGELPAAETAFTHVLSLDGENVIALKALADIAERQVRFDDAERWLRTLLAIDRSNDEARAQLGRVETSHRQADTGSSASPDAVLATLPEEPAPSQAAEPAAPGEREGSPGEAPAAAVDREAPPEASTEPATALGLPPLPEPPPEAVLAWVEGAGTGAAGEPRPLELDELDLNDAGSGTPPEGMELEQPVTLEEPVQPLSGLVGREDGSDLHETDEAWRVETAEDIVLESSGYSEFQVANASEELLTAGRRVEHDPLMPEAPAIEKDSAEPPAESLAESSSIERWPAGLAPSGPAAEADRPAAEAGAPEAPPAEYPGAAPQVDSPAVEPATAGEDAGRVAPVGGSEEEPAASLAAEPAAADIPAAPPPEPWSAPVADPPATPEPDLLVTESMAELLLQQGHAAEALVVYRHLERRTGNRRFQDRIADLERRSQTGETAPSHGAPLPEPARSEGGGPAFIAPPPSYSVRQTGGESVREFLGGVLARRLPAAPPATSPAAAASAGAAAAGPEGAPTRPAHDSLSLSSVFGDESTPTPPAVPAGNAASPQGGVSYDEFFGTGGAGSARPRTADAKSDDLDEFHAWLQNLKR